MSITETHPFAPWLPHDAKLLMCGTFPPKPNRWTMDFYYPNFINDMWRIFGYILHADKDFYVDAAHKTFKLDAIKDMLNKLGIALSDTGFEVRRLKDNASDKFLEIVKPFDITSLLSGLPQCMAIATTGEKAAQQIASLSNSEIPKVGEFVNINVDMGNSQQRHLQHWRMPSSSRAYPLKLEKKAEYYERMLKSIGII